MNVYEAMQERHQQEYHIFSKNYCFYAYTQDQFAEGMTKFGLDPEADKEKVVFVAAGCYVLADRRDELEELFARFTRERDEAIAADPDGNGFVYQMFLTELQDHEYAYTGDPEDAIEACGLTADEVMETPKLNHALERAIKHYMEAADW